MIVDCDGKRTLGTHIADATDLPDDPRTKEEVGAVAEVVEGFGNLIDLRKGTKAD